jgi:glycosyltransferase involved in cell wall biosynthesis
MLRLLARPRIAFVADCLDDSLSGGVISARRFIDHLQRDFEMFVIGTGAAGIECVTMPPIRLPSKRYKKMGFLFAKPNRARIAEAVASADIVHLQFPFWLSFVALEEAKKQGKPVVAAMHVQPENLLHNIGIHSAYLCDKIYDYYVENFYNRVDRVICPTAFAEEKLRAHGLTARAEIVSNGYSPDLKRGFFRREPADAGRFVIACVGRYAKEKRQELVIEAVRLSRYADRITLVLSGKGPRERELRELGAALPQPPRMGYLSHEALERLLNTADLFVHCGEVELEGMSVLDAMSVGLPALIADSSESAASRFALDSRFAFPAGDAQALSERIDTWIENPEDLRACRARARAFAQGFEFSANADKLGRVYRQLASARAARAA